jgi:hypothetical protein
MRGELLTESLNQAFTQGGQLGSRTEVRSGNYLQLFNLLQPNSQNGPAPGSA